MEDYRWTLQSSDATAHYFLLAISYFLLAGILMPRGAHRTHNSRAQKNYRDRDHPMLWDMCEMANIHHARNQDDGSKQIKSERHWRHSREDFVSTLALKLRCAFPLSRHRVNSGSL